MMKAFSRIISKYKFNSAASLLSAKVVDLLINV